MNATTVQPMALKALSAMVLARNQQRNQCATTLENTRNFYPEKTPQKLRELRGNFDAVSAWKPEPKIWISESGELRTQGTFDDLAGEIVKLTGDDLPLQRKLLERHCEQFDKHHLTALMEKYEERAAVMQYDAGMSREKAEQKAAEQYQLQAFV